MTVEKTAANNINLVDLFGNYENYRGLSSNTIRRRRSSIGLFTRYLDPRQLADATSADVEEFLARFQAARTRYAYRADLAALYGWAYRRSMIGHNPMVLVDSVKVPKGLPRPVPRAKVAAILAAAPNDDTRLMVALAVYAGLRRSEISRLDMGDVGEGVIVIREGKGGKDRVVPLHPLVADMLAGRRGRVINLQPGTVGKRLAEHLRACGVDMTGHALRHSFGTECARLLGGDLLALGAWMGHSSTETTKGYTAFNPTERAGVVTELFAS